MTHTTTRAVERVVGTMRENLASPFTSDEMARVALFSKFHFSRIFQDATGLSPGRFLASLRIAEAKRLLLSTSLTVTDISTAVGYASVGTFSTRFKSSVGTSPSAYRETGGFRPNPLWHPPAGPGEDVRGVVHPPVEGAAGPVFVGLYDRMVPTGAPVRCAVLTEPGPFAIPAVPPGRWHLLAYSPRSASHRSPGAVPTENALVARGEPVYVRPGSTLGTRSLQLRRPHLLEPPVLLAPFDAARALAARTTPVDVSA
jgi:AraC family transcriptional regulator